MEFLLELLTEELPASTSARPPNRSMPASARSSSTGASRSAPSGSCRRRAASLSPRTSPRARRTARRPSPVRPWPSPKARRRPDPAGKGFARSQGVDESLLEAVTTPRGEYLGFKRRAKGTPTADILKAAVPVFWGP